MFTKKLFTCKPATPELSTAPAPRVCDITVKAHDAAYQAYKFATDRCINRNGLTLFIAQCELDRIMVAQSISIQSRALAHKNLRERFES